MSYEENNGVSIKKEKSVSRSLHLMIDSNIKTIQNVLYITGGVAVIMFARSIYMTTVFTKVSEIPTEFFHRRLKLLGQVVEISEEGVLFIEHQPILRLRMPFEKMKMTKALPVHLACIDLSPEGRLWLSENVLQKRVWFHLLHRSGSHNNMGPHLYSKIEIPQRFRRNIHVNEELIKLGLSKISSLSSLEENGKLTSNQNLLLYLDRLVKLEEQASKKGVGMWNQPDERSWTQTGVNGVKVLVTGPVKFAKWLYSKWRQKK